MKWKYWISWQTFKFGRKTLHLIRKEMLKKSRTIVKRIKKLSGVDSEISNIRIKRYGKGSMVQITLYLNTSRKFKPKETNIIRKKVVEKGRYDPKLGIRLAGKIR